MKDRVLPFGDFISQFYSLSESGIPIPSSPSDTPESGPTGGNAPATGGTGATAAEDPISKVTTKHFKAGDKIDLPGGSEITIESGTPSKDGSKQIPGALKVWIKGKDLQSREPRYFQILAGDTQKIFDAVKKVDRNFDRTRLSSPKTAVVILWGKDDLNAIDVYDPKALEGTKKKDLWKALFSDLYKIE